jgi:hypothetical protein
MDIRRGFEDDRVLGFGLQASPNLGTNIRMAVSLLPNFSFNSNELFGQQLV